MKNVTITMPEQTLAKVRVEAANAGKSVSCFMTDLAEAHVLPSDDPRAALAIFLSGPLLDLTDENGNAPTRDQIYDREGFLRHQGSDLRTQCESRHKRLEALAWLDALALEGA